MRPRVGPGLLAAVLLLGPAACGSDGPGGSGGAGDSAARGGSPSPGPADGAAPAPATPSGPDGSGGARCPRTAAPPDPHRPAITLTFDVSADLSTVRGVEQVVFTPDRQVDELVFRLTANGPTATREGNSVKVTAARAAGGGPFRFEPAGADPATQGGLLVIPLTEPVPAGRQVTARVEFTLTLGEDSFERFGRSGGFAWWGTGQPLFAWERGVGWHREPLLTFVGESATSEAAAIDLVVTAPEDLGVLSSGVQDPPEPAGPDRRRWHATADTARDVSVAVGGFETRSRTVGRTRVTAGAPSRDRLDQILDDAEFAITRLAEDYGPFPYPSLTLARVPASGGAIEYPGSVLLMGEGRVIVTHEVAHEWFYGMVGNSQARDPWLDEAFASYSEHVTGSGGGADADGDALRQPGEVGAPMTDFDGPLGRGGYFPTVYQKGAAALLEARDRAGAQQWEAALRCYVNANAWRVARPGDLAAALAGLPEALAVLREAGALP